MYLAQAGSPSTTLNGGITSSATSIVVTDASVLPDAPNLLTLGFNTNQPETVLMTEKTDNTLTVTRNVEGTNKAWNSGVAIARVFTAKDYNDMKTVVELTQTGLAAEIIARGDADTLLQAQIDLIDIELETYQGNMYKSVYDPNGVEADMFDMDNMTEGGTNKLISETEKSTYNGKQAALVSGINIKTINGTSLLGSGDITVAVEGDMPKATYDPTNVAADAFSMANMAESATKKILSDTERTNLTTLSNTSNADALHIHAEIVNQNGGSLKVWSGTSAQFELLTPDPNTFYMIV